MATITPEAITPEILSLSNRIAPGSTPVILDLQPDPSCRVDQCNLNVHSMIEAKGGEPVFGWSFYILPGMYAEAFQHVVWRDTAGVIRDVTPCVDGQKTRMFIPDESCHIPDLWMSGVMKSKYIKISLSPDVAAYISAMTRFRRLRQSSYTPKGGGQFTTLSNIPQQEAFIMSEAQSALRRILSKR